MNSTQTIEINNSAIIRLSECPRSWELEYVQGYKRPLNSNMFLGGTIHLVLAEFFREKMNGEIPSLQDTIILFDSFFDSRAFARDDERDIIWDNDDASLRTVGEGLIEAFYPTACNLDPLLVEQKLSIELDGVLVHGRLDLVLADGTPVDFKTASRLPAQSKLNTDTQPSFYALVNGQDQLKRFIFYYLVKAKLPFIKSFETKRSKQEIAWLKDEVIPSWARFISAGIFPPNPNSCPNCTYPKIGICRTKS